MYRILDGNFTNSLTDFIDVINDRNRIGWMTYILFLFEWTLYLLSRNQITTLIIEAIFTLTKDHVMSAISDNNFIVVKIVFSTVRSLQLLASLETFQGFRWQLNTETHHTTRTHGCAHKNRFICISRLNFIRVWLYVGIFVHHLHPALDVTSECVCVCGCLYGCVPLCVSVDKWVRKCVRILV